MSSNVVRLSEFERQGMLVPRAHWTAGKRDNRSFRDHGNPGPNSANIGFVHTTRGRVHDAVRNTPFAARAVEIQVTNIVGPGIVPRPEDPALRDVINEWSHECDADGITDLYGLEEQVVAAWAIGGEAFVRMRPRRSSDGLTIPLQLQVLEADMLPFHDQLLNNGNRIVQGIEFDRIGRRVAYWFHREHPGDLHANIFRDSGLYTRVPAEQVCHIFEPMRPGQIRGFPRLANVLQRIQAMSDYDEATIERQKQASHITLIIKRPQPEKPGIDPVTGKEIGEREVSDIDPGSAYSLYPGEDVFSPSLPGPGENYEPFQRVQGRAIASGSGVPYELLTGDFGDLNDRTSRIIMNEFRRRMRQHQKRRVIHQMCRPIGMMVTELAIMTGLVPETVDRRIPWIPPEWPYLHPVQDVAAAREEIRAGINSRRNAQVARGYDPDEIMRDHINDTADEQRNNLRFTTSVSAETPQQTQARGEERQRAQAMHDAEMRLRKSAAAEHEANRRLAEASALAANAEAWRRKKEADLASARAHLHQVLAELKAQESEARRQAEGEALKAKLEAIAAARADAERESAKRIDACERAAEHAAKREEERRNEEQRVHAERLRIARLEAEAAELGLAELRRMENGE